MTTLGIIPARYASSRFPGKPLAMIGSKPMIQHVYERVVASHELDVTVVATDDERIYNAVEAFGGRVIMTSSTHRSGTERCIEVVKKMQEVPADVVINIQGDEPLIDSSQLHQLKETFLSTNTRIATLKKKIDNTEELLSPNTVKVITNANDEAMYFSRHPLPYLRGIDPTHWIEQVDYYKHVGIYAFRRDTLLTIEKLKPCEAERSESLEQLRWLYHGIPIVVKETFSMNYSIDTPAELIELTKMIEG